MEYLPAISILISFIVIFIGLIWKFNSEQLLTMFTEKTFLLLAAITLFVVLSVVHLFQAQTWTADVLKVIVGVLVGASAAFTSSVNKEKKKASESSVDICPSSFGNNTKIAGRDINEVIEEMYNEVSEIRDSVVNQYNKVLGTIEQSNQVLEYLFYTAFFVDGEPIDQAAKIIRNLQNSGWHLFATTASYINQEGIVLIFRRKRKPKPEDQKIPGTENYRVRIYHGLNQVELDYQ